MLEKCHAIKGIESEKGKIPSLYQSYTGSAPFKRTNIVYVFNFQVQYISLHFSSYLAFLNYFHILMSLPIFKLLNFNLPVLKLRFSCCFLKFTVMSSSHFLFVSVESLSLDLAFQLCVLLSTLWCTSLALFSQVCW